MIIADSPGATPEWSGYFNEPTEQPKTMWGKWEYRRLNEKQNYV